jgi:hypothetical protein
MKDLNYFNLTKITTPTLASGVVTTVSTPIVNDNILFLVDLSAVDSFTACTLGIQGSKDNITFTDLKTTGASVVTFAKLDVDVNKRIFTISAASDTGIFTFAKLKLTFTGAPDGEVQIYTLQQPLNSIDINNNKR